MRFSRTGRVVVAGFGLALCVVGPASGQGGQKGEQNQKDNGQQNQSDNGRQNQNDDGDGKRPGVAELRAGAGARLKAAVPGAVGGAAAVFRFNEPPRAGGVLRADLPKAPAGQNNQNDDGQRNQKDDGQRNQRGKNR
jgi:hypothetical protein